MKFRLFRSVIGLGHTHFEHLFGGDFGLNLERYRCDPARGTPGPPGVPLAQLQKSRSDDPPFGEAYVTSPAEARTEARERAASASVVVVVVLVSA